MKLKLFIFQVFCLIVFYPVAQTKSNELNIGIGETAFKHSSIMPSGAKGVYYNLDFLHQNQLKSNSKVLFGYFAETTFSNFNQLKDFKYNLYQNHWDAGVFGLRSLPVKNKQINFYAGGGILLDVDVYYYYKEKYASGLQAQYVQWFLSPFVYLSGDYSLNKFKFRFQASMPILYMGLQSRNGIQFIESVKTAITPNTFCFFTERFYPKADISVSYPLFSNNKTESRVQLTYTHEQLVYSGFPYERKRSNGLKLGMVWVVK